MFPFILFISLVYKQIQRVRVGYPLPPEKYQIPAATRKGGEHVRLVLALELPHLALQLLLHNIDLCLINWNRPVKAMQKTMAEFGLMVCVENYFRSWVVGEGGTGWNQFIVGVDSDDLFEGNVPDVDSHFANVVVGFAEIRLELGFAGTAQEQAFGLFDFFLGNVDPAFAVSAPPGLAEDVILDEFFMEFFGWNGFEGVVFFDEVVLLIKVEFVVKGLGHLVGRQILKRNQHIWLFFWVGEGCGVGIAELEHSHQNMINSVN